MLDVIRDQLPGNGDAFHIPSVDAHPDTVAKLLGVERRRRAIEFLARHGDCSFDDVVDYVTLETRGPDYPKKARKAVYVSLYQNHVPRLEDAGVLEFDKPRGHITVMEDVEGFHALACLLERASGGDER